METLAACIYHLILSIHLTVKYPNFFEDILSILKSSVSVLSCSFFLQTYIGRSFGLLPTRKHACKEEERTDKLTIFDFAFSPGMVFGGLGRGRWNFFKDIKMWKVKTLMTFLGKTMVSIWLPL